MATEAADFPFGITLKYFDLEGTPVRWLNADQVPEILGWTPYYSMSKVIHDATPIDRKEFDRLVSGASATENGPDDDKSGHAGDPSSSRVTLPTVGREAFTYIVPEHDEQPGDYRCRSCSMYNAVKGICLMFDRLARELPESFDFGGAKVDGTAMCRAWRPRVMGNKS